MKKVLIVNHRIQNCGVQQFGKRIYHLVRDSKNINFLYSEVENIIEYKKSLDFYNPDIVVYNWHRGTMPWLSEGVIRGYQDFQHYFIFHDEFTRKTYDKYLFFGDYDFTRGEKFGDKKVLLPRPLMEYSGKYTKNKILTIGSFGFGFWQKGFHTLTKLVTESFNKAILNLHMPYSYFAGHEYMAETDKIKIECKRLVENTGITLNITENFLDENEVLGFLAGNDINMFLYGENGEGISSVIDYALSVKRPIAISNSQMFRHISNDSILLNKTSIRDIVKNGTRPLEPYYEKWSIDNFRKEFDKVFL